MILSRYSKSMKTRLDQLITHWQKKKIITAKQAVQMRTDISLDHQERNKNRFIMALSTFGAMALGAGIILFVASNWAALPQVLKLMIALIMPVLPLSLAHWLLEVRVSYISLGRGSLFVGIAMIGAAIAVIGQVYHLESEYFRYLLLWSLLALPFVYWFKRSESAVLWLIIFGSTLFAGVIDLVNHNWLLDDLGAVLMPIIFTIYALGIYGLGVLKTNWGRVSEVFRILGVKLILLTLFVMTFGFYAEVLHNGLGLPEMASRAFLNVFYVVLLVYVLYRAIGVGAESIISIVFFWFGVFILFRYFDFFWDMLPTSLFFIVGGVIFLTGAIMLEKQRKKLLVTMSKDSVVRNLKYDE